MESQELCLLIQQVSPLMPWKSVCTELQARLEAENLKLVLLEAGCLSPRRAALCPLAAPAADGTLPAGRLRRTAVNVPPSTAGRLRPPSRSHLANQTSSCPRA